MVAIRKVRHGHGVKRMADTPNRSWALKVEERRNLLLMNGRFLAVFLRPVKNLTRVVCGNLWRRRRLTALLMD